MNILFKAQKIGSNEWVEGFFCKYESRSLIITTFPELVEPDVDYWETKFDFIEVETETVCQWTGLTDLRGNKVFDGDCFHNFYVEFMSDKARYVVTNGKGYDTRNCFDLDCDFFFDRITTGNIHDK